MVHITGGGLPGNIKRVIPDGLSATVSLAQDAVPYIFQYIMELGNINFIEMCSTFNMGTGFVIIVGKDDEKSVIELFRTLGESPALLGYIETSGDGEKVRIIP
jgi:phosphoribosylformylglycinamidine cyclo-ligase